MESTDPIQIRFMSGDICQIECEDFIDYLKKTKLEKIAKVSWNNGSKKFRFVPKFNHDIWLEMSETKLKKINPLYKTDGSDMYWVHQDIMLQNEKYNTIYEKTHNLDLYTNENDDQFSIISLSQKILWVLDMQEKYPEFIVDQMCFAEMINNVYTHKQFLEKIHNIVNDI